VKEVIAAHGDERVLLVFLTIIKISILLERLKVKIFHNVLLRIFLIERFLSIFKTCESEGQ